MKSETRDPHVRAPWELEARVRELRALELRRKHALDANELDRPLRVVVRPKTLGRRPN